MDESVQKHLKPELDEASRLLLQAADEIERRGWCQNTLRDSAGRMCVLGAIGLRADIGPTDLQIEAAKRFMRAIDGHGAGPSAIANWNDNPLRTKEQVVAKLRAVALGG